jgi:hypothetical protein
MKRREDLTTPRQGRRLGVHYDPEAFGHFSESPYGGRNDRRIFGPPGWTPVQLGALSKIVIDVLFGETSHHVGSGGAQCGSRTVVFSIENDMGSELPAAHQVSARPLHPCCDMTRIFPFNLFRFMRRAPSPWLPGAMEAA